MSSSSVTLGPELVERLAQLAHDTADDVVQRGELGVAVAGQVVQPLELEGDVGERLGDAVVQVAGDPGPFGFGAEHPQTAEPLGVVDREREQARSGWRRARARSPP